MDDKVWSFSNAGDLSGPYSELEVRGLLSMGKVPDGALILRDGWAQPLPVAQVFPTPQQQAQPVHGQPAQGQAAAVPPQAAPVAQVRPGCWQPGCSKVLAALGALVVVIFLITLIPSTKKTESTAAASGTPAVPDSENPWKNPELADKAMAHYQTNGFVKRLDKDLWKAYIDGNKWTTGLNVEGKEMLITVCAAYFSAHTGTAHATLIDDMSGKELATYGTFSGAEIKP